MSQNIFKELLLELSDNKNIENKFKILKNILIAIENIVEIKSLFGEEKVNKLMVSNDTITNLPKTFKIIFNLLSYKYRLTHDNNKKYNSNSPEQNEKIIQELNKAIVFIMDIVLSNKDNYQNSDMFGNNMIQLCLNQDLPSEIKAKIIAIMPELKTSKKLLNSIYWLNMPLGEFPKIIKDTINDSWTLEDLLTIKKIRNNSYRPNDFMKEEFDKLVNCSSSEINLNNHGVVFYELLNMKLDREKMNLSHIAYFMNFCLNSSFFQSRQPQVCEFAQNLIFKMKGHLSSKELDFLHEAYDEKIVSFNMNSIMKITLIKHIDKEKAINTMVEAIRRDNKKSGIDVLKRLNINSNVDCKSVDCIYSISHNISMLMDLRSSLDNLNIKLNDQDFMSLLMNDFGINREKGKNFIKNWALELILSEEIPNVVVTNKSKIVKF